MDIIAFLTTEGWGSGIAGFLCGVALMHLCMSRTMKRNRKESAEA